MGKGFSSFMGALMVTCVATAAVSWAGWQRDMVCGGSCGGACGPCEPREPREPRERPDPDDDAANLREQRYNEIYQAEQAARAREDYREALRLALQRQELRDGPKVRAVIAFFRGLIADQGGDFRTAIRYFDETVEQNPEYGSFVEGYKKRVAERLEAERQAAERRAAAEQKIRDVADAVNDNRPVAASTMEMMAATDSLAVPAQALTPVDGARDVYSKDIETAKAMLSPDVIRERTSEPNEQLRKIMRSLKTKEPPSPVKNIANLAPGDVVLVAPLPSPGVFRKGFLDAAKSIGINMLDRWGSDNWSSPASHAAIYLGVRNGKRCYLDNTSEHGPVIIEEEQFLREYGKRNMDVATLVGQPLSKHEGEELWKGAHELRKTTSYGIKMLAYNGNDAMVCSEAARWLLVRAGRRVPETESPDKKILNAEVGKKDFVTFSPADFYEDQQYFLIHQLSTKKIEKKKQ